MEDIIKIRLGFTNTYLLRMSDGFILIDVGSGNKTKKFLKRLDDNNITPNEIKYIVLTHAHYDHAGCLSEIKQITGAKVIAHKNAENSLTLGKNSYVGIRLKFFNPILKKILAKIQSYKPVTPDITFDDIYFFNEYGTDFKLIHTPGHSLCSISLIDEDGNAFIGDAAMGFPVLRLFSKLPIIAADFSLIVPSWSKIYDEDVRTIYISHGKPIDISRIKRKVEKWKSKNIESK
jgi:glyoxylase-like metal-dependent hydrolase (beta-lactamase superfamily II)